MDVTLALAVLLTAGFIAAKAGRLIRLPSVTGFIAAGVLLGPSGLNVLSAEAVGGQLGHFTQIALMLIALGIGEHLELKRLRRTAGTVLAIGFTDLFTAFVLVGAGMYLAAVLFGAGGGSWRAEDFWIFAALLSAVSVATAPGSILHVTRESRATGPLTTSLLQVVAVNNGLAIMAFGLARAVSRQVTGSGAGPMLALPVLSGLGEIVFSLLLGLVTGLLIDYVIHRLHDRAEMLTGGLALLLLAGELARYLGLSPLLVGIAVGFTIVNRDRRDVRLFRILNAFEPPIYVLFFTLAGAHLDFSSLAVAGWLGVTYFFLRSLSKICAAYCGGTIVKSPVVLRRYLGIALVPQAGVAIGLIFLLEGDPLLHIYARVLTPTVLAGVFLAELIGPASTRFALIRSGEATDPSEERPTGPAVFGLYEQEAEPPEARLVPWVWEKLKPEGGTSRAVIFGVSHRATVGGLARMATLLAHHYGAVPLAVRVRLSGEDPGAPPAGNGDEDELFEVAAREVREMGYALRTADITAESVADGIIAKAGEENAAAILLGYPLQRTEQSFSRVVEAVSDQATCPLAIVRFSGILHTERILAPLVHGDDLELIGDMLCSLAHVGKHRLTLLRLVPPDVPQSRLAEIEKKLYAWATANALPFVRCVATGTEARLETIVQEALQHDLLVMAVSRGARLRDFLFGSLADDAARQCRRPMLLVRRGRPSLDKIGQSR